jgi:hypothetical protein
MQGAVGILRPLTLILTLALILVPASISAQDGAFEDLNGGGLTVEGYLDEGDSKVSLDSQEGAEGVNWERSQWTFAVKAALPPAQYPEAMVVKVIDGSFAFRVGDEDVVIVDPQGAPIPILESNGNPLSTAEPIVSATPTGANVQDQNVQDQNGDCTSLCILSPDETVMLETGFTVYLPGNVTCFFCNITDGGTAEAKLLVIAAVPAGQNFSWTELDLVDFATTATPVAVEVGSRKSLLKAALPGVYVGCM